MTRKEEIKMATEFEKGAEWADTHPNWISVEDELPPLRQRVLAYNGVTIYIAWVSDDFVWRTHKEHCFHTYPVTHWMLLPLPPVLSNSENTGKDLKGGEK